MYLVEICNTNEVLNSIIELRYLILRKPWNKEITTVTDELENVSINAYIKIAGNIVACGRLQNNGNNIGQIRYMAVDDSFQGKGLGKLIIEKLENEAITLNLANIELQARENAVEFYKTNGYCIKEKSFLLWDIIQHHLMVKML